MLIVQIVIASSVGALLLCLLVILYIRRRRNSSSLKAKTVVEMMEQEGNKNTAGSKKAEGRKRHKPEISVSMAPMHSLKRNSVSNNSTTSHVRNASSNRGSADVAGSEWEVASEEDDDEDEEKVTTTSTMEEGIATQVQQVPAAAGPVATLPRIMDSNGVSFQPIMDAASGTSLHARYF